MKDKIYDCAVIGAGPAGLFAAIHAASSGAGTILIERNMVPGKKLLITGSGRCNLTRDCGPEEMLKGYGSGGRFLKHALYSFDSAALLAWFSERGAGFITEENGKVFPSSGGAAGIREILTEAAAVSGVRALYGFKASETAVRDSLFETAGQEGQIRSRTLIIACGGSSYPSTGSSGQGYTLAARAGHSIITPVPALTPIVNRNPVLNSLSGISFKSAKLTLIRDGSPAARGSGDILFTHTGLSGPGVLDMSREIRKGDLLSVNLCGLTGEEARQQFREASAGSRRSIKGVLIQLGLPERVSAALCLLAGSEPDSRAAEAGKALVNQLSALMTGLEIPVEETGGFNIAMATAGGVSLKEVNPKTMESRLVHGLFFAGETLDIDGNTGGYNLQAAFSTGRLAGLSAAEKIVHKT